MYRLFEGPPRGILQLIASLVASFIYFFVYDGRYGRRYPTFFEEFQSGNPNDFVVVFTFGLILWIGYSVAVVISDYRATGRLW